MISKKAIGAIGGTVAAVVVGAVGVLGASTIKPNSALAEAPISSVTSTVSSEAPSVVSSKIQNSNIISSAVSSSAVASKAPSSKTTVTSQRSVNMTVATETPSTPVAYNVACGTNTHHADAEQQAHNRKNYVDYFPFHFLSPRFIMIRLFGLSRLFLSSLF